MSRKRHKSAPKKIKEKPVFELVKGVLGRYNNSKGYLDKLRQNYVNFVFGYRGEKLSQVYQHLLNDVRFRKVTPIFNLDFESTPSQIFFEDIPIDVLLDILLTPLNLLTDKLVQFENDRAKFEELLFVGNSKEASSLLERIYDANGDSIWLLKAKLLLLSQHEEHGCLAELIAHYKQTSDDTPVLEHIRNCVNLFETGDPKLSLNNSIIRNISEFIDGEAFSLAAINTLLYLPFPSNYDVHPYFALKGLQSYNYIDLYIYLNEVSVQTAINDRTSIDTEYKNKINERITEVISLISPKWNVEVSSPNKHLEWYKSHEFLNIINELEDPKRQESNSIVNVNIYAKSYLYLHRKPSQKSPYLMQTCIENLINIYSLRDVQQSISKLETLIYNTLSFDISKHVTIAMEKALLYYSLPLNRLKISLLPQYTYLGGTEASLYFSLSPKTRFKNGAVNEKEKAKHNYLNSPSEGNFLAYLNFEPLYKDILEVKAKQLQLNQKYDELLDFVVSELKKNELSYICFPMQSISNYIDQENLENENAVIFYYFYSLLVDKDSTDTLNQIFDEFILSNGMVRPSEYFGCKKLINEKEIFILSEISKVSVMDYMGCFSGTSDLMYERINILDFLKDDPRTDSEKLENEYQDILKEILLLDVTATLNTAKIFVDKQSIVKINKGKINSLVFEFLQVKEVYSLHNSKDNFIPINNVLVDLYGLLMNEYLNNLEYGLDSNLSGEIRHTYFSNLLSSKPEHFILITEIGSDGKYKSNTYWLKEYSIVNPKIMGEIDLRMKGFSQIFNELIDEAEGWMKVSNDNSKPERVFLFEDPTSIFNDFMSSFLTCTNSQELVDVIFGTLDAQLDTCLKTMRNKIDHDFANALDDLFEELLFDVERIKKSTSLTNLVSSIQTAKNDIKEDVKTASDWFNLRNNKVFSSYPISEVITIAERCFRLNKTYDNAIKLLKVENTEVNGLFVPKLIMALNNCFANAKKHIKGDERIEIEILSSEEDSYKIRIFNGISAEYEKVLLSGVLDKARTKLKNMDENSLLVKEGGTGLYKSKFKLRSMSEKFDLRIDVKDRKFITEVLYNA
ncbi:MAG: hypothetical protein ACI9YE_002342 [Psychroserpens sp.]|jgi:hypothetical protein